MRKIHQTNVFYATCVCVCVCAFDVDFIKIEYKIHKLRPRLTNESIKMTLKMNTRSIELMSPSNSFK